MKGAKPIIGFGIFTIIMGSLFFLQGNAITGPESSFMYSNPRWVDYGQHIAIAGIFIVSIGAYVKKRNN